MRTANIVSHYPAQDIDLSVHHVTAYIDVRAVKQNLLQPNNQHHDLVTTELHGLLTVVQRVIPISLHRTFAARGIMEIASLQSFGFPVSIFFDRHVRPPKHMIVAQCGRLFNVLHAVNSNDQMVAAIETPM